MIILSRAVSLIFLLLVGFFTFYQMLVGDPFKETMHPVVSHVVFLCFAVVSVLITFRMKRQKDKSKGIK